MNKNHLLILAFIGISFLSAAQEKSPKSVRTEPNGVMVYEAQGNESVTPITILSNPTKSMNDWSLEECENALYYIELKIQALKTAQNNAVSIKEYEAQKKLIQERVVLLNAKN